MQEVQRLELECDLIVIPFVEHRPWIFKVGDDGVEWCEQYACIGSGGLIADSMLSYRKQDEDTHAYRTMYYVHEAMMMGAKVAPAVGEGILAIVYEDNSGSVVSEQPEPKYKRALKQAFKDTGPQLARGLPPLTEGCLKAW